MKQLYVKQMRVSKQALRSLVIVLVLFLICQSFIRDGPMLTTWSPLFTGSMLFGGLQIYYYMFSLRDNHTFLTKLLLAFLDSSCLQLEVLAQQTRRDFSAAGRCSLSQPLGCRFESCFQSEKMSQLSKHSSLLSFLSFKL